MSAYSNVPLRQLMKTANADLSNVPGFGNAFQAPMANMSAFMGNLRNRQAPAATQAAPAPQMAAAKPPQRPAMPNFAAAASGPNFQNYLKTTY